MDRIKMFNRLNVTSNTEYEAVSTKVDAENATYNDADLSVRCLVKGIFADALAQIQPLLADGETLPEFKVSISSRDSIQEGQDDIVTSEYPTKTQFCWHHRVPI